MTALDDHVAMVHQLEADARKEMRIEVTKRLRDEHYDVSWLTPDIFLVKDGHGGQVVITFPTIRGDGSTITVQGINLGDITWNASFNDLKDTDMIYDSLLFCLQKILYVAWTD